MPTPRTCADCGVALTADAQGWLCVRCLLKLGLETELSSEDPAPVAAVSEKPELRVHFERSWALAILNRVLHRLQQEYEAVGKGEFFKVLQQFLHEKQPTAHKELANRFGLSDNAVRVAILRLRKRYGALIRKEIEDTVNGPKEIADELKYLISILRQAPQPVPEKTNPLPDAGAPPRPEPPTGESK